MTNNEVIGVFFIGILLAMILMYIDLQRQITKLKEELK